MCVLKLNSCEDGPFGENEKAFLRKLLGQIEKVLETKNNKEMEEFLESLVKDLKSIGIEMVQGQQNTQLGE